MAHLTALAAARNKLLADRDWDVERRGLSATPAISVLTSGQQHASIDRAVRVLGFGTDAIRPVGADRHGRLDLASLERQFAEASDGPTILCLQAGDINTGAFDPFDVACELAHRWGAWVHVDGAFGLWAAVSGRYGSLLAGVEEADSWVTDGHKWLNVPYDSGFAFIRHPAAHRNAMSTRASYLIHADAAATDASEPAPARDQIDWNPEWSRRGRGFAVYAAIRSLGRDGIRSVIES